MNLVLIGAREDGQAHVVLEALAEGGLHEVVAFLDEESSRWETKVMGIPVLGPPTAIDRAVALGARGGFVSIGSGRARERLGSAILDAGLELPPVVHPRAYVAPSARLGRGVFVGAEALVSTGAVIGDLALVPPGSLVSHHVVVEPCASLSPGARLGGRSRLGRRAFLGIGATVLPDVTVGEDAVVGAGAAVTRDVAPGITVAGVPARELRS